MPQEPRSDAPGPVVPLSPLSARSGRTEPILSAIAATEEAAMPKSTRAETLAAQIHRIEEGGPLVDEITEDVIGHRVVCRCGRYFDALTHAGAVERYVWHRNPAQHPSKASTR